MITAEELAARGEIGGRTVQIAPGGEVECHAYPVAPLPAGMVRVRTAVSALSPGTEMTYLGAQPTNPHLRQRWDPELRLFQSGGAAPPGPIVFGYRACGTVVESAYDDVPPGSRIFGKWRHTELTAIPAEVARAQALPPELDLDDGVDIAHMLPICVNAVAHAQERHAAMPVVVFGCGPVGLIVAQVARATGAAVVYAVDRIASRLAIAEGLGLVPIDATRADVAVRLKRDHGADGIPVVFECTGSSVVLNEAVRTVRRRGLVVAVGFYQGEAAGLFLGNEFHHNGVEIRSGQIGNPPPDWTMDRLRAFGIDLARRRAVVLGGLPRARVSVQDAASAFALLARPAEVLQVALSYPEA
ncbi:MAG: zinc-binding alcohol dehydrogenase [Candidatus Limnocylindria bacterium]